MTDFKKILKDGNIYFFDGGYGTLLMQRGLPPGMSPELFGLKQPEVVGGVHEDYRKAGATILTTNTFGGTSHKLGLDADAYELNREMCRLAKKSAAGHAYVAASVGPTGLFVKPLGEMTFREMVDCFKEQIRGCVDGGADLILGETHFDLAEARAVVVAAREVCDLPVGISMTFEQGRTLTGTTPLVFVDTVQNMGVDLVATNCSAGPEQILDVVQAMLPRLSTPLYVAANAGLPELDKDGNTVFRLSPEAFAEQSRRFAELGAKFIGGCCGTGPDHIRALVTACEGLQWKRPEPTSPARVVLTSRAESVPLGLEHPAAIIGERINPTGKKNLTAELQEGRFDTAIQFAQEQLALGAPILDVNVGAPMVDEVDLLPRLVTSLVERFTCPLCLDSPNVEAVKAALDAYPGSALVNSISGEPGRMAEMGPLCRDYGAPFILLPLEGRKLPVRAKDRLAIIERLVAEAEALGIPRRLIVVDGLALTVSSKPEAAKATLETIRYCTETLGLATTLGLSNISFGLPARELLNSTFLALCLGAGMTSFIGNPASSRLRETMGAAEVLLHRDPQAGRYIASFSDWQPSGSGAAPATGAPVAGLPAPPADDPEELFVGVITGCREAIVSRVEAALERGADPFALVNGLMIPAIMIVGEKYERKEYFLPQLLLSAETMQKAFERLKPLLEKDGVQDKPTVVMATVEGDIHDIGKNIVCLMLRNHGFNVVDLGKDVAATTIVDAAEEHRAGLIGLSALMTTTMVRMEDTVKLVAERGLATKVIIGGAVVTDSFCQAIGAHGFSTDAVEAVKLANRLIR
ncbi:MAG: homocysteine S-methyltransferase family protein [Proteobacteria bacterium]|nr:homocysteine S-methyltransferase family protein [Pseudomonadota bacterium]MBU1610861.1 homocysteine S-methyltransferase family protein [Pseudomonadota bacterium]